MPIREAIGRTSESSAIVDGLNNFYIKDGIEQKTDLKPNHITHEMCINARKEFTEKKWGIKRHIVTKAIQEFDIRRVSTDRKGRGEMERVLSAEAQKEKQTTLDSWMGSLKR